MKSLQLTAFAPPAESVRLVEVPGPRPGPDQVLVAVEAAAINPSDFLIITGRYGALPALPARLGAEGVGVVVEVGSDVDSGRIGERVLLTSSTLIGVPWKTAPGCAHALMRWSTAIRATAAGS